MYRFRNWAASASLSLLVVLAAGTTGGLAGCHTAPEPIPEDVTLEGKSDARILYEAIRYHFRRQGLAVDVASERFLLVTSEYEEVDERLRRRIRAQVIPLKGASALRVQVEYQRRHGSGDDAIWKMIDGPAVRERARSVEVKLARAIESTFEDWKDQK